MMQGNSVRWSEARGWGNIVGEDMLSDKRCWSFLEWREVFRLRGLCEVWTGGSLLLVYFGSRGELNIKWLLCMWTSWWNHHQSHGQSAKYNFYIWRNKMKQITRVQEWQVAWLACWVAQWVLWLVGPAPGCAECVGRCLRNCSETYDKIQYTNKEKW